MDRFIYHRHGFVGANFVLRRVHPPRAALAAGALLFGSVVAADAGAFEHVTVGVGFLGQFGGNFLDKPDDQSIPIANLDCGNPSNVCTAEPEYPGFAGATTGGGFFVEVRFLGEWIGLEFDVLRTFDRGEADLTFRQLDSGAETKVTVNIAHDAWHLPLLVKGTIPGEIAQPQIFLGPEFVFADGESCGAQRTLGDADKCAEFESELVSGRPETVDKTFGAYVENYTMFTFGLGVEFKLPLPVEFLSVRIPFQLRGSINPAVAGERTERARQEEGVPQPLPMGPGQRANLIFEEYSTQWKFQAAASIGASVFF
jgi:hypothetical protein